MMKKLILLAMTALVMLSCVPATSNKVKTVGAADITASSVILQGAYTVDISQYQDIAYGFLISSNEEDIQNRNEDVMIASGKNVSGVFETKVGGLVPNEKYYYCAFLILNDKQYEYGAMKSFRTEKVKKPNGDEVVGIFSVSSTKQVRFSKGNLQYTRSTDTWSFAATQYEMIGEANVQNEMLSDKIDLFGWSGSTGAAKWGVSTSTNYSDYSGSFVDWGRNIGDGTTWRTLSADEWEYLISERDNASNLQGIARIQLNGSEFVNGLILLPDGWQCPAGITFKSGFANDWSNEAYGTYQTFTLTDWAQLEAAGAVFLPAAGLRNGDSMNLFAYYGSYWSSTEYDQDNANYLRFGSNEAYVYYYYRYFGRAVRLCSEL